MDGHQYTARFEAPGGKPVTEPYLDTKGIPTVGLGHTGPDVKMGDTWTEERCWHAFYQDYAIAETDASHVVGISVWALLNEPRRAVLADMAFNLGKPKLSGFKRMIDAIRTHDWPRARAELLDSQYASDVKTRATTNAQVLLTGEWAHEAAIG